MADEQSRKPGRWTKVILAVSLAFNLLVVGAVAGAVVSGGKWRHHGPPRLEAMGGPLTRALSQEDRRAIGREILKTYGRDGAGRARHREEFERLVEAIRATPFDRAAAESRLASIRGMFQERLALGQTLLLDRLEEMSDDERAAYADRLMEKGKRRR